MPGLGPYLPGGLFLLGVAILVSLLLRRYYRYFGKKRRDDTPLVRTSRCEPDRQQPLLDAPPDILRWQVEMHETARDLKAELDTKMVAIQHLVALASGQADRLEQAVADARRLGLSACRDTLGELERVVSEGGSGLPVENGRGLGNLPEIPERPLTADVIPPETHREIRALASAGLSPAAIAQQTGRPPGDIEMALSLDAD